MSITDELREYSKSSGGVMYSAHQAILAIADRIDAEHQKALDERDSERFNALMDAREKGVSAVLKEPGGFGLVELPKDADGEYIHIGDVLTDDAEFKSEGVVECLMLDESGWFVGFGKGWTDTKIHEWHHYHAPTVEDVLREFTDAILEWAGKSGTVAEVGTWSDVAAQYVTKLRLAEGED